MPNEKTIVIAIMKFLRSKGAWVIKTHGSPVSAGLPDLLVCYKGRFIALEVKTPDTSHTATPRQLKNIENINKAGGYGRIVVSVNEVRDILDRMDLGGSFWA